MAWACRGMSLKIVVRFLQNLVSIAKDFMTLPSS